jgi:hypothetical protein
LDRSRQRAGFCFMWAGRPVVRCRGGAGPLAPESRILFYVGRPACGPLPRRCWTDTACPHEISLRSTPSAAAKRSRWEGLGVSPAPVSWRRSAAATAVPVTRALPPGLPSS